MQLTGQQNALQSVSSLQQWATDKAPEKLRAIRYCCNDTQVERRLKKLREAGKIRYDKSAKGWFAVTP